ncbi:hypothetical protein BT93_L0332 [Corymbia citriodora subsp. variegata]|uniref:NAC domain-containing protein n=1 Tax=Corymbia citriodora subsp. variegata TaxID=360336 RepID=A0A8T0CQ53_CORYI|nr:hypothetical protein BT93_L0332 [Corymbia citriodora subsp. variegata]
METRIYPMNILPAENELTKIALFLQQEIVGYRFCPTEEELINHLKLEVTGCRKSSCIVPTLENIYEINPWDLPAKFNEKSIIPSKDQEWWFICPQTQNQRISRKTPCGFSWNITGKHKNIKAKNDNKKIGSKKILVFHDGRNSKGTRSNWVMHELHPHPDDMGYVLCCLKMKQDEKADNKEPSLQVRGNQPNDAAMAKNRDIPSIPRDNHHFSPNKVIAEVSSSEQNKVIAELHKNIYSKSDRSYQNGTISLATIHEDNHHFSPNQEHLMRTIISSSTTNSSGSYLAVSEPSNHELQFPHPFLNVDETSGTSNFIGDQADKSCYSMDCEKPEQLSFAEHQVQEMQNQLNELITNGSSSSTEILFGSCTTITEEHSRIGPWMSPHHFDSFPNGELYNLYDLTSEPEAEIEVSQYGQLRESTSWDNLWPKSCWPGPHIQQGRAPLQEEKGFVKPISGHLSGTEKIITGCASSDGVSAEEKGIQPCLEKSQTKKRLRLNPPPIPK